MTRYHQEVEGDDGWTRWVHPVMEGYRMGCCDCGLVHDMDFRVVGDRVEFRARRNERATAAKRRWKKVPAPQSPETVIPATEQLQGASP